MLHKAARGSLPPLELSRVVECLALQSPTQAFPSRLPGLATKLSLYEPLATCLASGYAETLITHHQHPKLLLPPHPCADNLSDSALRMFPPAIYHLNREVVNRLQHTRVISCERILPPCQRSRMQLLNIIIFALV